ATVGDRSSNQLTAGGELRTTEGSTNENFFFSNGDFLFVRRAGGEQQTAGAFVQNTFSGQRWEFQIGARGDRWESEQGFRSETSRTTGVPRLDLTFEDRSETEFSPRVAAVFDAGNGIGIRGSVYEAFRAPSINELYRPFRVRSDITAANEALVPENLTGTEVGVDFRGGKTVRGKVTGFWNEIDDPIANVTIGFGPGRIGPCGFTPGGGACRQRQNLDQTEVSGLEAEIDVRPSHRLRMSASYLYSDTEITGASNQPALRGNRIAQVPETQVVVRASYASDSNLGISIQARFVDDQFEDDLNTRPLDSFTTVDVAVTQKLNDGWTAFLRLENIFDEEIQTGRTETGLTAIGTPFLVHGGVRVRLRH
ncbi:MAG: TonB-dependent receptor, partial [Acidobacteriota bacterium]|nr:TonB-dependent receptor [Acidobacteriota bacterium]